MELYYEVIRNSLGKVDQVIRRPDGASLLFDPISKQFDEEDVLTLELREWSAQEGELDLSDRPIEPLTLEQAKAQKKQEIIAIAAAKQEELVAGFAPPEQASWSRKVSEAKAFLASEVIQDAPMLRVEARSSLAGFHPVEETEQEAIALSGATNETVILRYTKGLASKILAKSEEMYLNSAAIAGTRSKLVATIEACQNDEELNAIAWN